MSLLDTRVPFSVPEPLHQASPSPISQKIDILLGLDCLSASDRGYLLRLKCRDEPLIVVEELEAIAQIYNRCGNGGAT